MENLHRSEPRDIVIVHGAPGAGKGTMSQQFALENNDARHISAGDTIRSILAGHVESRYVDQMKDLAKQKILMPGYMSADVMLDAVNLDETGSIYLFDGFPQRKSELDALLHRAQVERVRLRGAICLEVSQTVSIERMESRGLRSGEGLAGNQDTASYYRQRYESFMEYYGTIKAQIAEVMDVIELDADEPKSTVYRNFSEAILKTATPTSSDEVYK